MYKLFYIIFCTVFRHLIHVLYPGYSSFCTKILKLSCQTLFLSKTHVINDLEIILPEIFMKICQFQTFSEILVVLGSFGSW